VWIYDVECDARADSRGSAILYPSGLANGEPWRSVGPRRDHALFWSATHDSRTADETDRARHVPDRGR